MRKYVVIALVLLVGGIGISFYLIPTETEVATLQQQDVKAIDLGNVDVEAEYNQGRRTFPIINALADKRVAEGDRAAAIKLLEEFIAANPNDVNGRKKLAEQYQAANDLPGYFRQMEALGNAEPTEEILRWLSDNYNAHKEYVKQAEVLKKLLALTQGNQTQVFVDLATIQVAIGDTEGALKTVQDLKTKHPTFSSYPMTRIMVSVLSEKGKGDEAYAAAKEWMQKTNAPVPSPVAPAARPETNTPPAPAAAVATADDKPKELADLCNILHYSGQGEKAVMLVEPYKDMLPRSPDLALAYVNANITTGKADQAYQVLKGFDDVGQLAPALYPPYLDLTLKREDKAGAEAIVAKLAPATFSEDQALNMLDTARTNNAPAILSGLAARFNDAATLKDKPVLDAVIAILTNHTTQDQKIETALNLELTSTQRIRLAESCARANKTACFEAIVKQYPPINEMLPVQVAEFIQIHIIANRAAEILDGVTPIATAEHAAAIVKQAYRRLAAAAGRHDVLKPWLEANANNASIHELQELFYLANDRKHSDVGVDIAERLYARDPSPMNRDIVVVAYLTAEAYDKALPILREQVKDANANDGMYITALSKLARRDAAARKELGDYARAALQSNRGDDRAQLNYAYALVNQGRKAEVIPFAKEFAKTRGGEWKKMYAQLTMVPKAGTDAPAAKLSREQMVAMAKNPSISTTAKRQLAFNLLDAGHKADATVIFKELATDKGPDSQEVKDLMYLWGGKLEGQELAWVMQRAASASAYDRDRWSALISNSASDEALLAYVSNTPQALYNRDLRQNYFRVLALKGGRSNYEDAMRNWVAKTTDIPALLDYASIGQNAGYRDAATTGYERVLALDPNNARALSELGVIDYSKGRFRAAEEHLNRYAANQGANDAQTDPALVHFYRAQLLRRQGKIEAAQAEFRQMLQLASQQGASTPDALSRVYSAKFHLGEHREGKAGFEQLLEQYPDDKGVLADYMSVLIEYNYLDDATRIANQYDKNSPYYHRGAAVVGQAKDTVAIRRMSSGREMKISFASSTETTPPVDINAVRRLPWVERSEVGYDSVSITAKPGYVVRYRPTSNEQFAVVATRDPIQAMQLESQRQQDLRLQLLYASIEERIGQQDKAAQRLAALDYYYPNDPQLLSYKAAVESARGNTDEALGLIAQARRVAPENEDLTLQAQNIGKVDLGRHDYVKLDHEYRQLGDNREHITTLSGGVRSGQTEFGVVVQNDSLAADNIRRARDGVVGDYDVSRQRGEVFVAQNYAGGARTQASLYANNKDLGAGLSYAFDNTLGRTEVFGEYQRPYWDFVEAVYEHTTRDRLGVKHYSELRPGTSLGVEGSYNNYNTDVADDVAETALLRVNLMQEIQPKTADQPYLGVGYGFDGEYRLGTPEQRLDGSGNGYYALPVRTREVHALTGIYRDDWGLNTHALLIGGIAYDRINGGVSPLAEARVDHDIDDQLQVGARARYAVETNNTDNEALNLGADVLYKF